MCVFFFNNFDIRITIDPLLNNFRSDSIDLILFSSLSCCDRISLKSIDYIPDVILLKYSLSKITSLRLVFKAIEFFSLTLLDVIVVSHFNDLKKGKISNNSTSIYTKFYNLINSLIKIVYKS